ncbi:alternative ribosome rescue aminoacyl-tRNA hydrolase ArfB [Aeoliella sp.]|uniref:alternative ribosome rescue aminoacyl-tRNA hydrolase ArfB n=1 Tax=Aeoliella sp. TaxID=2795800 RepID=UPI003CCBA451
MAYLPPHVPVADYLTINDDIAIPRSELNLTFSRSPGPGGQNVNKVNSKATLRWEYQQSIYLPDGVKSRFGRLFAKRINDAGELVLSSSRHREQRRNVDDCLEKLRQLVLAALVVPKPRKPRKKSAAANAQRLKQKRQRSERKQNRRPPRIDD